MSRHTNIDLLASRLPVVFYMQQGPYTLDRVE